MTAVWAHRGASAAAPENTLPAFALALEQGAHGIELDVHLSCDGEVIVIHDDTLDRTCGVPGTVAELPAARLRATQAANGMPADSAHVPTLDDVFDLVGTADVTVNIEVKGLSPGLPEAVLRVVRDRGFADRVLYSSFNHYALRALLTLGAVSPLGVLLAQPLYEPWRYAAGLGAQAVHPPFPMLQIPGFVTECHRAGLEVNVWAADTPETWDACRNLGVDALITDLPAEALAAG